ncbi:hypothetical protein ANME2D_01238 [Candidatus Methanoperedens nitroreducens]|uniref:Uncharacterized protein n=1 Tax=Candidatus Methanoperedens nitratireducens TaxID=1392998 RepID=A0A062V897_9EURY|nr:hypothetical protein [Candidatus Methanoperedens nitroreducens]KCZ72803.1 hypothetical protein ANME2D_01238 [Candidatus Methanoperedens nitroreducens]MDJ1423267.1 hypothetical protein [Candidatus Methanoperedens sp.]
MASIPRQHRFIYILSAWMLTVLFFLIIGNNLDLEMFFVLNLIGFLVLVEITTPFSFKPEWKQRLKWVVLTGTILFLYIVAKKIIRIIG